MPAPGADSGTALFATLAARGRFTGTDVLADARRTVAGCLRDLGFTVVERPFRYSTLPARVGMPAVGAASVVLLLAVAWVAGWAGPLAALVVATVALGGLRALARWLSGPRAIALPWAAADGVNLEAARGSAPRVWLVAHLDSKSQRYPIALRALGAALSLAAWGAMLVVAAAGAAGALPWVVGAGLAGGLLLALGGAGNASPGAVDNASGVAAVLATAERLDPVLAVGVLITDAEDVGLAGAHAWARDRAPGVAVNCDTVDDRGRFLLLVSGRLPAALHDAVRAASAAAGVPVGVRRLPA
ncbi:MAG: M28 family peptidase, partial [Gemmatimonadota bacterium]|nr:M28 family peptidase [Gemmatimonadota bacterium]